MTSVYTDDIYSMFLGYVKDNDLLAKKEYIANEFMSEWLKKAYSKPYVRRLFSSISCDDESLHFELKQSSSDENADNDFVVDILALGMVISWLSPIVRNKVNLSQLFTGKEQKFYSQSAHIEQLRGVLEDATLEQRRLIQDWGYMYNSYLEES